MQTLPQLKHRQSSLGNINTTDKNYLQTLDVGISNNHKSTITS